MRNFLETPVEPDYGFKDLGWMEIKPGTKMEHVMDQRTRELGGEKKGWEHENWKAEPKTYKMDSGVIAYVDEEGRLFVAPATEERREAIKKSGYTENQELHVPLIHGEIIADEDERGNWDNMFKDEEENK
ncbi:MAG: hypothetical protein WCW66_02905 [Patescibacteria group bacterium]|jgi:hypothetical protein